MNELDFFGKKLIRSVRDYGIKYSDSLISGKMKGIGSNEFNKTLNNLSFTEEQLLFLKEKVVPRILDSAMDSMLMNLESEERITVYVDDINIVEESDGLCGELQTEDGWIEKYSKFPPSF